MNTLMKIIIAIIVLLIAIWANSFIPGIWLLVIIIAVIIYYIISLYNNLVDKRNSVKNAWSKIDVQLNRRADLIENLVQTVKGYSIHEKETLTKVAEARSGLLNSNTVPEIQKSNDYLSECLAQLYAVCEQYPDLKASTNFLKLQSQLENLENSIAQYRESYNNYVLIYNNSCEQFPSNVVALLFDFLPADFFETEEGKKRLPKVEF